MKNANLKNELTELFYSLPISEEKNFDEWLNEQRIIKTNIIEYNLEDGYAITENVICVEDRYFQFDISNTFDGTDYETNVDLSSIVEVEAYTTLVTYFKKVK